MKIKTENQSESDEGFVIIKRLICVWNSKCNVFDLDTNKYINIKSIIVLN